MTGEPFPASAAGLPSWAAGMADRHTHAAPSLLPRHGDDTATVAAERALGFSTVVLPELLGDEDHASLLLTATYPTSLLVFGGDLGHAHHPPPSVAVPPWLYRLEARVGSVTAAAITTSQTNGLLLP
jgi:hypothetical protein